MTACLSAADNVSCGFSPEIRQVNPSIPEHLDEICSRLLAKQPRDRFQSARETLALSGTGKEESASAAILTLFIGRWKRAVTLKTRLKSRLSTLIKKATLLNLLEIPCGATHLTDEQLKVELRFCQLQKCEILAIIQDGGCVGGGTKKPRRGVP